MSTMQANATLLANEGLCTVDTCPLTLASVDYIPSLGGNSFYAALFGVALLIQLGLGIRYKTWTYMWCMLLGLAGEVVGYIGRINMHNNPFDGDAFLQYLVSLTISPAFLSAAIYLCLSRIVVAYGEKISFFRPRTYTITFITFDFIALLLQAIGGAIAATAPDDDKSTTDLGINIMIAGLAWQVASIFVFSCFSFDFARRVRRAPSSDLNTDFDELRKSRYFRWSLVGLSIATLAIFVRSVFRCAELSEGFDGALANDEITFMVLEGVMICIAVICQTVFHPGAVWKSHWAKAVWHARSSKNNASYHKATDSSISMDSVATPLNSMRHV